MSPIALILLVISEEAARYCQCLSDRITVHFFWAIPLHAVLITLRGKVKSVSPIAPIADRADSIALPAQKGVHASYILWSRSAVATHSGSSLPVHGWSTEVRPCAVQPPRSQSYRGHSIELPDSRTDTSGPSPRGGNRAGG